MDPLSSSPQTPPRAGNHKWTTTYIPNPDCMSTHTPNIDRSPNPNRSRSSPSSSPYASQTIPSTPQPHKTAQDTKAAVTRFNSRITENVFQGFGREDGERVVIDFGVDCARKVVSDEDAGVVFSPVEPVEPSALRVPEKWMNGVEIVERTLAKPKALLENVVGILR